MLRHSTKFQTRFSKFIILFNISKCSLFAFHILNRPKIRFISTNHWLIHIKTHIRLHIGLIIYRFLNTNRLFNLRQHIIVSILILHHHIYKLLSTQFLFIPSQKVRRLPFLFRHRSRSPLFLFSYLGSAAGSTH